MASLTPIYLSTYKLISTTFKGPSPKPGDWEDWGPCSESCKQGTRTRTRDVKGLALHANETKPCYNTCPEG